ncbi:uncharacterized protein BDW47DRAFT_125490 [Aspergillus candidus]|uniref:Uncharacterized protein n=1 Tax=Aspergillus candidus TaxID=41067 RepID=A0A2I2FCJ9_ASPCN|nr:hypothetical protein BDW47DRAFT_125490 [Aspergillus candidus]PLB38340.1 hypothetical protein BDW47DRAFT_125490 [Aspergillus candidus]
MTAQENPSTSRPPSHWNPTAPSLLWAHELRRENIHLINRLDTAHAELTSLTSTVAELRRTTAHLAEQITTVDNRYEARLDGLRDGFTQRVDLLVRRVDVLEGRGEASSESDPISDQDQDKDENTILVPDSFPLDKRQPDTNQQDSNPNEYNYLSAHPQPTPDPPTPSPITATRTTTTSTVTVTTRDSPSPSSPAVSEQPTAMQLQQGSRPLEEYIRFGGSLRAGLKPCKREGEIVGRFVKGLSDEGVRGIVERRMDCVGWVWERMVGVLREVVEDRGGSVAVVKESGWAAAAAGEDNGGKEGSRRGKRRRISIVSPDEEDLLQMAGMHVG